MTTSLDTASPSPIHTKQDDTQTLLILLRSSLHLLINDSEALRCRIDSLLDKRGQPRISDSFQNERGKRLKEDSFLLIRGFDSVSNTLSLLSNNLDNALQGARELGNPPTLTDKFKSKIDKAENNEEENSGVEEEKEESKQGVKRKIDEFYEENVTESQTENGGKIHEKHINKAKNITASMASKATSLARELKSLKSDLCFMQERCGLLEEKNR